MSSAGSSAGKTCKNCQVSLPAKANYCPQCSQRYRKGKLTVMQLLGEFFETLFNFDNKIFRTLAYLVIPGMLTRHYIQGRQVSFISPIRLFLVSAILFFSVISFLIFRYQEHKIQELGDSLVIRDGHRAAFLDELDVVKSQWTDSLSGENSAMVAATLDTFWKRIPDPRRDSIQLTYLDWHPDSSFLLKTIPIAKRDFLEVPVDDIPGKYGIRGLLGSTVIKQLVKLQLKLGQFIGFVVSQTVWTFLLLIPLLAFVLKLIYIRHPFYYMEHLVFAFHLHAFIFLFSGLVLLGTYSITHSNPSSFFGSLSVLALGYIWFSMKRLYGQRVIKTSIKFMLFNLAYVMLFSFCLTLSIILATILF